MSAILDVFMPMMSLGIGYGVSSQVDTSNVEDQIPGVEFFVQGYSPLPIKDLYLRPTFRLAFERPDQLEKPKSLFIQESTLRSLIDLGIVYDGLVVPSFSLQGGLSRRSLSLKTSTPIVANGESPLTRSEYLWNFACSAGFGLPIMDGRIILEPYYRFNLIEKDVRQRSQLGFEVSLSIPLDSKSHQIQNQITGIND
ncbi:MAG: hypothetical protein ACO3A4_00065 [Silvanigrellaceae bacterium]